MHFGSLFTSRLASVAQAASNAKENQGMSKVKLYVSECYADGAGRLTRVRARAKGRCGRECQGEQLLGVGYIDGVCVWCPCLF